MDGGLFAAFSITNALHSRELGNSTGEYIDVAMTDVIASFSHTVATWVFGAESPQPGETSLPGRLRWYDVSETADGAYVTLPAIEPNSGRRSVGR